MQDYLFQLSFEVILHYVVWGSLKANTLATYLHIYSVGSFPRVMTQYLSKYLCKITFNALSLSVLMSSKCVIIFLKMYKKIFSE